MVFSDRLIRDFRNDSNRKLSLTCRVLAFLIFMVGVFNHFGIFVLSSRVNWALGGSIAVLLLPTVVFNFLKKDNTFIHYFVLTILCITSGLLYSFLSYHVIIMLVVPVVASALYSDSKSTLYTCFAGLISMIAGHLIARQLLIVPDEPLVELNHVIVYGIIPRTIQYIGISVICLASTKKHSKLIKDLVQKNQELFADQETVITSLSEFVESLSHETGLHVKNVGEYTKILCSGLGCSEEEVWKVGLASMMHDVGKIMVPREILEKTDKLTDEEFEIIKQHIHHGKKLLEKSPGELMKLSATIAYEHHERWDGTGYLGLKGEEIDIFSRCVALADVFDALVSERPYKKPWTPEEAKREIVSQTGQQFDPRIVEVFLDNFELFLDVLHGKKVFQA